MMVKLWLEGWDKPGEKHPGRKNSKNRSPEAAESWLGLKTRNECSVAGGLWLVMT